MMKQPLNKTALKRVAALTILICGLAGFSTSVFAKASIDHPIVQLRSLDKITARTQVFEAKVGQTIKFGSVYIKVQACRKAPELEQPEAAAFLQVWEIPAGKNNEEEKAEWIFSGWMFASSPGLSAMDHPIYDVWVLDCLKVEEKEETQSEEETEVREDEGILDEEQTPQEPAQGPTDSE